MTEFQDYKNYGDGKEEDVPYFCKLTFGQFFTILVLEVVTLAFIFYLGAKYGTDYLNVSKEEPQMITEYVAVGQGAEANLPEALKDKELQAMAKDAVQGGDSDLKERVREMLEKQKGEQGKNVIEDYQGIKGNQVSSGGAQSPPAGAEAPATTATGLPAQTVQQQAVSSGGALSPPVSAATQPLPPSDGGVIKVKSSAAGQYSVQLGSYPKMEEASAKVEDWRQKGYASFMMIADIPDRGRWYRVRIGGFGTKEDAQSYLDKIKQSESVDGIVVLNEQ